tara:strand:- start:1080 stop:4451 length:3372 start_codon:yes stop_codon:yes gene_type:complete
MTKISLPNGMVIDFQDAPNEVIEKEITSLRNNRPELFEVQATEEPFDYGTASLQDIRDRAAGRKKGSSQEEKLPPLTHPEAEVANASFQYFYGKADNDAEREKRLLSEFGPNSFERRGQNNYILNLDNIAPEIKEKYELPENGTMQVNRKGFSRYDLARFGGEYKGVLTTTLAAGLASTGVGIIPAMGIMGLSAAAGKGVDEYLEHLEGFQEQDLGFGKGEIYRDMAYEAGMMAAGEGIFRGLFGLVRRVIKGPGPKPVEARVDELVNKGMSNRKAVRFATEEARVAANRAIRAGARPNIEEATGKAFLGRMQAIYEAILPNRKAARKNSDYVKEIIKKHARGDITEAEARELLKDQASAISNMLKETMANPDEAILLANRHLTEVIDQEFKAINKVITKNLKDEGGPGELSGAFAEDFSLALSDAARLFKQDSAYLYKNAETALEGSMFNGAPLVKALDSLTSNIFELAGNQGILGGPLIKLLKDKLAGKAVDAAGKPLSKQFSMSELNALRSAINAERNNPMLIGTVASKQAGTLAEAIDQMLVNQQNILGSAIFKSSTGIDTIGGAAVKTFQGFQSPAKIQEIRRGYEMLAAANKHYGDGKALFSSEAAELIIKKVEGKTAVDMSEINQFIVNADQPEKLKMWLNIVEPSSKQIGKIQSTEPAVFEALKTFAERGNVESYNLLRKAEGLEKIIPRIPAWVGNAGTNLADKAGDAGAKRILKQVASEMNINVLDATARRSAPVIKDRIRDMLGNQWLRTSLRNNIDETGTNLGSFATDFKKIKDSGVAQILFGNNFKRLDEAAKDALVVNTIKKGDAIKISQIGDDMYLPAIREEIGKVQATIAKAKAEGDNVFLKAVSTGRIDDLDTLVTGLLKKGDNITTLMNSIRVSQGDEVAEAALESIRDMTMARIVNNSFPDGITPGSIETGAFGEIMETSIKKMNANSALANILGSQKDVDGLLKIAKDAALVSNQAFKGKAGLAPAVFIAGAGLRLLANPAAFAGEIATIYGLGKILRSRLVLNWFTKPQMRTGLLREGKGFGLDLGEDIISYGTRRRKELINQQLRKVPGLAISESVQAVDESIPEEFKQRVSQGINQGIGSIGAGRDVLREIETNKVLGIR